MKFKYLLSIAMALIILFLSLENMSEFEKVSGFIFKIPHIDKIVHTGMYFVFMSVIIFENRNKIKTTKFLFLVALIPFFYGILMEILQFTVTSSRSASIFDVMFNSIGILFSIISWQVIKPHLRQRTK